MRKQPSREALLQRIAALEAALENRRPESGLDGGGEAMSGGRG
ncbi:MAG: hypothetical protein QNJ61_04685 [Desulfobacterales bacterium]|nr:hypothetical protein [Desulfobacterales bacterium]